MSTTPPAPPVAPAKVECVLVQVPDEHALIEAARATREAGYRRFDAHSPFPVHGIDAAAGIQMTKLSWLVFGAGVTGALLGLLLQWWTNATDATNWLELPNYLRGYNYRISGKPFFSLPANIPVMFELTILLAAFAAVFGMLALNNLPLFYNALFNSERFRRVTDDGFFISISASDPKFDAEATPKFAESLRGTCETIYARPTSPPPRFFMQAGWVLLALACLPPVLVAKARFEKSPEPRIHPIQDMDNQPRYKAQQAGPFNDNRAMRAPVVGTVAREDWPAPQHLHHGGEVVRNPETGQLEQVWFDGLPREVPATRAVIERGEERFNIYCATCHGYDGRGNGMVNQRAIELQQGWIAATNLHTVTVRDRADGHLYNTITNGIRSMPGYGDQISVEDRWAIVLYVRALQESSSASLEDIPEDQRLNLR